MNIVSILDLDIQSHQLLCIHELRSQMHPKRFSVNIFHVYLHCQLAIQIIHEFLYVL